MKFLKMNGIYVKCTCEKFSPNKRKNYIRTIAEKLHENIIMYKWKYWKVSNYFNGIIHFLRNHVAIVSKIEKSFIQWSIQ